LTNQNSFSSVIIGEGTLTLQCAEVLLDRGHEIRAIISSDGPMIDWARTKGIPHLLPSADLMPFLCQEAFDYLFSIVNFYIVPQELLDLPRRCAINFHDALLPRYAGTYATSWALMHRETTHGVTWHVMTDVVDAGDILKQRRVEITEGDTAYTLNMKCYEAAIQSFPELVDELSQGRVSRSPQNLEERTYFAHYQRPVAAGVISWNRSADDIDAFVRALEFGPYRTGSDCPSSP
jgi:methionyl-tRNA formyltransferase